MKNSQETSNGYLKENLFRYEDIGKQYKKRLDEKQSNKKRNNFFYLMYGIGGIIIIAFLMINSNLASAVLSIKSSVLNTEKLYRNNQNNLKEHEDSINTIIGEKEGYNKQNLKMNEDLKMYQEDLLKAQKSLEEFKKKNEELEKTDSMLFEETQRIELENFQLANAKQKNDLVLSFDVY